jgi:hypothetical protein
MKRTREQTKAYLSPLPAFRPWTDTQTFMINIQKNKSKKEKYTCANISINVTKNVT